MVLDKDFYLLTYGSIVNAILQTLMGVATCLHISMRKSSLVFSLLPIFNFHRIICETDDVCISLHVPNYKTLRGAKCVGHNDSTFRDNNIIYSIVNGTVKAVQ